MFPSYHDFTSKKEKVAIIGLGYVGLPLAVYLSYLYHVIGFDVNSKRIEELKNYYDRSGEITPKELKKTNIEFTFNPKELKKARLLIVTVPTPIDDHKLPDLVPVKKASEIVSQNLSRGSIIVYESTVYPGVTEDICIPILENQSNLQCGIDFKIGYSPERINPGDKKHSLTKIKKIISAQDKDTAELLSNIYGSIIEAGIHIAPDIRTAEAAKVIENIQRDLNIALMNELAIIFDKLKIDTQEVLEAAATKWNFLKFEPGLVGGHCIGVDPYYLTFKAEEIGYHPNIILAGRRINDGMGKYIAEQTVKHLIKADKSVKGSRVLILGITFKENVKDIRNSKIVDIYYELKDYGIEPYIYDPLALPDEVKNNYKIDLLSSLKEFDPYDAIILAVKHKEFIKYDLAFLNTILNKIPVLIDIKSFYDKKKAQVAGFIYWRL